MILTCDSAGSNGVERVVRVERAPSPAALDFAFDFDVDLGTDYPARVSRGGRGPCYCSVFYILYFGFLIEGDSCWFVPPPGFALSR